MFELSEKACEYFTVKSIVILGGEVTRTSVFLLATIACFNCHWQYLMSCMCALNGENHPLAACKQPGNEASCWYQSLLMHPQGESKTRGIILRLYQSVALQYQLVPML